MDVQPSVCSDKWRVLLAQYSNWLQQCCIVSARNSRTLLLSRPQNTNSATSGVATIILLKRELFTAGAEDAEGGAALWVEEPWFDELEEVGAEVDFALDERDGWDLGELEDWGLDEREVCGVDNAWE